jgi:hypothetical protein
MDTNMSRDALRDELRSWGKQQRRLAARRDALVRQSLAARISIEEIHQSMGIARTTIDRIGKAASDDD